VNEALVHPQRVGLGGYAIDAEDTEMPDIMHEKFPAASAVIGMIALHCISCLLIFWCSESCEYVAELNKAQHWFIFL